MAAIAVGAACIDRAIGVSTAGTTMVTKEAAADGTGTITSIKVFPATSMTGFDAGVFTDNGGNDLTCTKAAGMSVAAVATACRQFTSAGLDFTAFAVTAGQYAGLYTTTGGIERVTDAGAGYWTKTGDYCADDTNSAGYTWYTPRTISLLLEGETGGGTTTTTTTTTSTTTTTTSTTTTTTSTTTTTTSSTTTTTTSSTTTTTTSSTTTTTTSSTTTTTTSSTTTTTTSTTTTTTTSSTTTTTTSSTTTTTTTSSTTTTTTTSSTTTTTTSSTTTTTTSTTTTTTSTTTTSTTSTTTSSTTTTSTTTTLALIETLYFGVANP